jgi:hypothetical protein
MDSAASPYWGTAQPDKGGDGCFPGRNEESLQRLQGPQPSSGEAAEPWLAVRPQEASGPSRTLEADARDVPCACGARIFLIPRTGIPWRIGSDARPEALQDHIPRTVPAFSSPSTLPQ